MGSKPNLKEISRDLGEAFNYILQLSECGANQAEEIKQLQKRIAYLESKVLREERETRSINHYLAPDQKLPTSG